MEPLGHLLSADSTGTLQFFFVKLAEITAERPVDARVRLYQASVLAHFASTSTSTPYGMPTPASLADVFDRFVVHTPYGDSQLLEVAAGQCLLMTGFFADQMDHRFNLDWYGRMGAGFYHSASVASAHPAHRRMMARMAEEFAYWRGVYHTLALELRDGHYLIGKN
jgi:hypothetical protein